MAWVEADKAAGEIGGQWVESDPARNLPDTLNIGGFDTGVPLPESLAAGLVGAGKSIFDLYQGGRDLVGLETTEQPGDQAAYDALQGQFPVSTFVGEVAPYMAASFAAPPSILGQGALAGGLGFTRQQGDISDRLRQGAYEGGFGAAGAAAGNMAGRIVNRAMNVKASMPNVAQEFAEAGGKVTPAQATGSNTLARIEAPLESMGVLDNVAQANQELMQEAAAKSIGLTSNDLSGAGLSRAADEIGARFTNALKGVTIDVPEWTAERIAKIKNFDQFIEFPDSLARMGGDTYKSMRSTLSKAMSSAYRTQNEIKGDFIADTIKQLDREFMKKAGAGRAKDFAQAREQWKNLLTLEKGRAVTSDGQVNPQTLYNNFVNMYGKTARRGKTDKLMPETAGALDMARMQSSKALKSVVGDSGTATRSGAGLGPAAIGAAIGYGSGGDMQSAVGGALAGQALKMGYMPAGKFLATPTMRGWSEVLQAMAAEQARD